MASVAQAAAHLFLSERRFHELLDQGTIERAERGAYDLDQVREQYIEHLRAVAAGRASELGGLDLTAERARVAKEQADGLEMKNAAMRGELLPRADVHAAVTSANARVRAKLLSMPGKLAPILASLTAPAAIKERLTSAIYEALSELAETIVAGIPGPDRAGLESSGSNAGMVAGVQPAAGPDGEPVGGSGEVVKPRGKRRAR